MGIAQLTNADMARLAVCRRQGHLFTIPWRQAKPGDQHWCDYCMTRRVMAVDGRGAPRPIYYPCDQDDGHAG
jgi:hypothetical protein